MDSRLGWAILSGSFGLAFGALCALVYLPVGGFRMFAVDVYKRQGRVFSVFENPNAFAEVLVMLIPLAAALVLCSKSVWGRLGALCAAGVGIMALGMTYSRASWIGAVVSAAVLSLIHI